MKDELTVVRHRRRGFQWIEVERLLRVPVASENPVTHVLLCDDRSKLAEYGIAAGVVTMMMGVDDELDWLIRQLSDLGDNRVRHGHGLSVSHLPVVVIVDDQHTFVGDEHP